MKELARLGEYVLEVLPWPAYDERGECWWTVRLQHESRQWGAGSHWLAWNGWRLSRNHATGKLAGTGLLEQAAAVLAERLPHRVLR